MRIGLTSPQTFLALLVRRKWWVIVPFLAIFCVICALTWFLPKAYVSESLVLIQPRDVPKDFVKDLITGSTDERLNAIQQQVESRTNLLQILRDYDDILPEFRNLNLDDKVTKLRSQMNIIFETQVKNKVELPVTYFRVTYQNQNPTTAQKIAGKLTTLFIEQDSKTRETQVFGTTEFFTAELAKTAAELQDSEAKLKEMRSEHEFDTPNRLDSNLRTLDRLEADKKNISEGLDRIQTMEFNAQATLAITPEFLPVPVAPVAPSSPAAAASSAVEEYKKAKLNFDVVSSRYSAIHPDVMMAKAIMERLKEQLPPESAAADGKPATPPPALTIPNPAYQALQNSLRQYKTEADIRSKEKIQNDAEIARYNQRVDNTPKTEVDMADIYRKHGDIQKKYDDLSKKLSDAQLSESLESKQKGAQFIVVDPANFPLEPTKPNKPLVLLGGLVASLMVGMAFAVVVDIARQRVWTQSEIEQFWGAPVLVDIPEIVTDSDLVLIQKQKVKYVVSSVAVGLVYSACIFILCLKHNFILEQLDPVLQKVVYK